MSASDLIKGWTANGDAQLTPDQTKQLLDEIGIPMSESKSRPGIELRLALEQDVLFGSIIAMSFGRMAMDIWDDVTYRIVPLTDKDAHIMVGEPVASSKLLQGYRDAAAPNVQMIEQAIMKLSQLAEDNPQLQELELESVMAYPDGLVAQTANVRLAAMAGEQV